MEHTMLRLCSNKKLFVIPRVDLILSLPMIKLHLVHSPIVDRWTSAISSLMPLKTK